MANSHEHSNPKYAVLPEAKEGTATAMYSKCCGVEAQWTQVGALGDHESMWYCPGCRRGNVEVSAEKEVPAVHTGDGDGEVCGFVYFEKKFAHSCTLAKGHSAIRNMYGHLGPAISDGAAKAKIAALESQLAALRKGVGR